MSDGLADKEEHTKPLEEIQPGEAVDLCCRLDSALRIAPGNDFQDRNAWERLARALAKRFDGITFSSVGAIQNPEQHRSAPVADMPAPSIRDGKAGLAPGRGPAVPDQVAHSMSEYRRLTAQGAAVLPPAPRPEDGDAITRELLHPRPEGTLTPQPSALSPNLTPQAAPRPEVAPALQCAALHKKHADGFYLMEDWIRLAERLERELAERTRELAELHEEWATDLKDAAGLTPSAIGAIDVDWLANVIRTSSGDHLNPIGAGALAEKIVEAVSARSSVARSEGEDYKALYMELIMAVARKWPNETRHQTALRYINNMETNAGVGGYASSFVARSLSAEQRERVLLAMQDVALTDYSVDSLGQPRHLLECSAGDLLDCVLAELTPSAKRKA